MAFSILTAEDAGCDAAAAAADAPAPVDAFSRQVAEMQEMLDRGFSDVSNVKMIGYSRQDAKDLQYKGQELITMNVQ